jgi:nitrate/TMAO reductase-like tetraheme cytochrome c subunit
MDKQLGAATFASVLVIATITLALWLGFNEGLEATNTEKFCLSCHEMDIVYEEYKESMHYKNVTGVKTTCADCHVPKAFFPKMYRKILAANDVYHTILGTINTPEKMEARRLHLAKRVWDRMKESDSGTCRSCHNYSDMELDEQDKSARKKHTVAINKGKTCIDCHKGLAHDLPDEEEEPVEAQEEPDMDSEKEQSS